MMKYFLSFLFLSFVSSSHAVILGTELTSQQPEIESFEFVDSEQELQYVRIRDIKNFVSKQGPSETCLDEMLKRRRQLFLKLAFIPAVAPVAIYAYPIGFGFAGVLIGFATEKPGADLAGFFLGVMAGAVYYVADTGITTTRTIKSLVRMNLMIKSLGEQYLFSGGSKSDKFYDLYLEKAGQDALGKQEFFDRLVDADREGLLCDGTIVKKKPRIFKGVRSRFLKFRVAHSNDFISYLLEN